MLDSNMKIGGETVSFVYTGKNIAERKYVEEELLLFQKINNTLYAGLSQEKVFKTIADSLRALYNYDSVAIHLLSKDQKHIIVKSYSSDSKVAKKLEKLTGLTLQGYKTPLYEGSILKEIVDTKKPIITEDITWILKSYTDRKSLQKMAKAAAKLTKARWGIGVPLLAGDKVVGIIGCGSIERLTDEDAQRLANFGAQAGLAIERRQKYETLQKMARELAESEEKYRSIIQTATDAIVSVGEDMKITLWNKTAEKIFGYSEEEALGKPINIIIPKKYREMYIKSIEQTLKIGNPKVTGKTIELEVIRRDGTLFPVELSFSTKKKDESYTSTNIIRDITKRKQAAETIRRKLEFEKTISNISSRFAGVSGIDDSINVSLGYIGRLSGANRAYLFLLCKDKTIKDNAYEWCAEGVSPQIDDLKNLNPTMFPWWMAKLQKGEVIHIRDVSKMPPEARTEMEKLKSQDIKSLLILPLRVGGELAGFIGLDNTIKTGRWSFEEPTLLRISSEIIGSALERKWTEETLRKTTIELERSNKELEQFAYIASHDLQEPLRMVASYVQLIERKYKDKLDKDAEDFIAFAVDGATRMREMINDLLAYSRVGTKGKPFMMINSTTVLDHAISNLKAAIEENSAVITYDPLPTIMVDDLQLIQLFQNLIANAIKFRGDDPPNVHISANLKDEEWVFSVRDTGIGINPEYAERIFVIFQRLHGRGEYPGTGIGLAVCKRIVERHGGSIWIESEPEKGSTFYFTIPRMEVHKHESWNNQYTC
ncbi:MAG: ATP-binding protein [Candidatus Hydrothermarchaeales archaeon]